MHIPLSAKFLDDCSVRGRECACNFMKRSRVFDRPAPVRRTQSPPTRRVNVKRRTCTLIIHVKHPRPRTDCGHTPRGHVMLTHVSSHADTPLTDPILRIRGMTAPLAVLQCLSTEKRV